ARRPEAHQHDEDEGGDQEEAEPDKARGGPGQRDPVVAPFPLDAALLAERALVLALDLELVLLDVDDVEARRRIRGRVAGHPLLSRRCGSSRLPGPGEPGTCGRALPPASAHRL